MREIKKALRKELIERRKSMDILEKSSADRDIFDQLKAFIFDFDKVFTYASTEIEVNTRMLIDYCIESNIPVALPVCGDTELKFYYIRSKDELKAGRYNIDEPPTDHPAFADENTLCVVPALCADGEGLRLGYGKGYYDRFLKDFRGTSVIICYDSFRQTVPSEPHDKKADITIFNRKTVNNGRK